MHASPVKRRVLGGLDPNACSPQVKHSTTKQTVPSPVKAKAIAPGAEKENALSPAVMSPAKARDTTPTKRRSPTPPVTSRDNLTGTSEPAPKRLCLDGTRESIQQQPAETVARPESPPSSTSTTRTTTTRLRSASPDLSSFFDNSQVDNSQVTILTEPDTTAPAPAAAPAAATITVLPAAHTSRRLTREQTREKAEILRLRLGLASYKVRTGQTDVPLERLEAQLDTRPTGRRSGGLQRSFTRAGSSSFSHGQGQGQGQGQGYVPARPQPQQQQQQQGTSSSSQTSASFPPPPVDTAAAGASTAASRRRPLPGAPVRRASSASASASASAEQEYAVQQRGVAAPAPAPFVRRGSEQHHHHAARAVAVAAERQRHHQQHARRQSAGAVVDRNQMGRVGRRQSVYDGAPPAARLRALSEAAGAPGFRVGAVAGAVGGGGEEEEEDGGLESGDDGRRGGAASGLLSLARS